jgi:hypothetical protein
MRKLQRRKVLMTGPGSRFGFTDEQWALAKDEVREAILEAAYDRRMTWYGEVADGVSVVRLDPHSALMIALLGAVFEDEHKAERSAQTSIVTHKYGDKESGPGFYDKDKSLAPLNYARRQEREFGHRIATVQALSD